MPMRSQAQRAFMHARHPDIARRWERETPPGRLPKRVHDDILPGGIGDDRDPSEFDPNEVGMGIEHEMEHTDDRAKALEIALDHLSEDPRYYSRMRSLGMESRVQSHPGSILIAQTRGLAAHAFALANATIQEAKGNITRILGLSSQTADIFQGLFGSLAFTGAKACLLMAKGNKERLNSSDPQAVDTEIFELLAEIDAHAPFTDSYGDETSELAREFSKVLAKGDVAKRVNSMRSSDEMLALLRKLIMAKKDESNAVMNLPGGWKWIDLGKCSSSAEAVAMGHCGFDQRGTLMSLRDAKGSSHVTITLNKETGEIHQIKGKGNSVPVPKYWPAIAHLMDHYQAILGREGGEDGHVDIDPKLRDFLGSKGGPVKPSANESVNEAGRQNSVAMVVLPGQPPGRNVSGLVRSLAKERSRLIVVAQPGGLAPGGFERMLRASLPDCEKRIRVIESGGSLSEMISAAVQNRHYSPKQVLQVFCDSRLAGQYTPDSSEMGIGYDPGLISVRPIGIPQDDTEAIKRAVQGQDRSALHRVLDPHLFSDTSGMAAYSNALLGEGLLREFLSDIAPSRELAISRLRDLLSQRTDVDGLQYLGSGRNGSAYRHPDGFVMKVTTDPTEARSATRIAGSHVEHLGEVYSVERLDDGIWLIEQEDLDRLPPDLSNEFDMAMEALDSLGVHESLNQGDVAEVMEALMTSRDTLLTRFAASVIKRFDVIPMCREMRSLGLTGDFHSGNIMLRGSSPILTDLGTPGDDPGIKEVPRSKSIGLNEFGTGSPGSGASGPATMRGTNSSSWSNGRGALKSPINHIPDDPNTDEKDFALDWGPGRVSGASL